MFPLAVGDSPTSSMWGSHQSVLSHSLPASVHSGILGRGPRTSLHRVTGGEPACGPSGGHLEFLTFHLSLHVYELDHGSSNLIPPSPPTASCSLAGICSHNWPYRPPPPAPSPLRFPSAVFQQQPIFHTLAEDACVRQSPEAPVLLASGKVLWAQGDTL